MSNVKETVFLTYLNVLTIILQMIPYSQFYNCWVFNFFNCYNYCHLKLCFSTTSVISAWGQIANQGLSHGPPPRERLAPRLWTAVAGRTVGVVAFNFKTIRGFVYKYKLYFGAFFQPEVKISHLNDF